MTQDVCSVALHKVYAPYVPDSDLNAMPAHSLASFVPHKFDLMFSIVSPLRSEYDLQLSESIIQEQSLGFVLDGRIALTFAFSFIG